MDRIIEFASNHYILVTAFFLLWTLFFLGESKRAGQSISPQQATNLINRKDAVVVDLRDKEEFDQGHIAGALNIPWAKLDQRADELEKHKDKPIILVCRIGQHASAAGKRLAQKGFSELFRISGGIQGWKSDNLPVVKK